MQTRGMNPDSVTPTERGELGQAVARGGPMDGARLGLADADLHEVRLPDVQVRPPLVHEGRGCCRGAAQRFI